MFEGSLAQHLEGTSLAQRDFLHSEKSSAKNTLVTTKFPYQDHLAALLTVRAIISMKCRHIYSKAALRERILVD